MPTVQSARTIQRLKTNKMFWREGRVHLQKCLSLLCLAIRDRLCLKRDLWMSAPCMFRTAWNALNAEKWRPKDWHPWVYIALNVHHSFMNAVSIRPKIFLSKVNGRNWVFLWRQHGDVWKFLDYSLYTCIKREMGQNKI